MLGSALYYPYIDIKDSDWLRAAVLFWDSLQTIAPRSVKDPYKSLDTKILWKEGFLEPLRCDLHPELLDTLGKRVVALMDRNEFGPGCNLNQSDPNSRTLMHAEKVGTDIRRQFHRARIHPEKLSPELRDWAMRAAVARMHPEKLSPRIRDLFDEIEYASIHPEKMSPSLSRFLWRSERFQDRDGEWLLLDSRFAEVYMSALAAMLAKETDTAALTNEEPSMAVNLHTILEDVKASQQSDKKGALVSFIMESIRIDPNTRIDKLLNFKRSRTNQLAELSAQFDDISSKISSCETAQELEEKVRIVYANRVRPKLEALKQELKENSIQSLWEGMYRAVTVSVPAGGALAYFTGFSGQALLAAGAVLAVTDVSVKTHLARRKTRRTSPYTYLLDIERKFSPTDC
ncbi:hypothetical protein HL658_20960 [Azospirillum sp. RWY-5-1]|uniref:Protein kinase domain-containing protein n=1 Tax=Azospirillum oleiclasticum TaxID=2735135 RepID=A0ABX2TF09_9PROT|nr:DUF6236 family protein [Azospirillum oleiclasticum]NYZ15024.1 hypothetical protein [Azospirillum oleiclasticum]NYZ22786.1 hypothetical protein [Azospirillum oleiclasticum]